MIALTQSFRAELRRLAFSSEQQLVLRVTRDAEGELHLESGQTREGDTVLIRGNQLPTLIASPQVAADLDGSILHFRAPDDDQFDSVGVVLLRPRAGQPRSEWTPADKVPASRRTYGPFPAFLFRGGQSTASTPTESGHRRRRANQSHWRAGEA